MTTENKRDLAADLAICEAATDGPWLVDENAANQIRQPNGSKRRRVTTPPDADGIRDALFTATARDGWPHAIRRAIDAESRLNAAEEQVGALIELLRETIDMITPNETDYKCDYRRRYVRHQIGKIVPEVGEDE